MTTFDPYYKWLGIPPAEQPPNHYRLLGIALFETDPDVIAMAADQRMSHLRTFQAGPNGALSQKLLNELATARLCLLKPASKSRYDAAISERMSSSVTLVQATPQTTNEFPEVYASAPRSRKPNRKRSPLPLVACVVVLILAPLLTLLLKRRNRPPAQEARIPAAINEAKIASPKPVASRRKPKAEEPARIIESAPPSANKSPPPADSDPPAPQPAQTQRTPPGEAVARSPSNPPRTSAAQTQSASPAEAVPPQKPDSESASDDQPQTNNRDPAEAKLPVPDDEAQNQSAVLIKEVYKADYDKAKNSASRLELANKLLQEGVDIEGDPTGKFVLLRIARDVAVQVGDPALAIQVIDTIDTTYQVDAMAMKVDALTKIAKSVSTSAAHQELVAPIEELTDMVVESENFPVAQQLSGLAINASRHAKDTTLLKRSVARGKEIDQIEAAFAEAKQALAKLEHQPTDPAANLVVGKFRCFYKGDWEHGLPSLALSSDAVLKGLAEQEANPPATAAQQVALGDGWWTFTEKETGFTKRRAQQRAAYWYQQALPNSSGLAKAKLEKRLAEVNLAARSKRIGAAPLFEWLSQAVADGQTEQTSFVGTELGMRFDDICTKGGLLVGFDLTLGRFGRGYRLTSITSATPVYLTAKGVVRGKQCGRGSGPVMTVIARNGYAVGKVTVLGDTRIQGMRLTFLKIRSNSLNPKESYDSPYVGGQERPDLPTLGNAKPIVGITGNWTEHVRRLAFINAQ